MPRLRFTVAYDGRPYLGWQSQPGGQTVQDHIEEALSSLVGNFTRIHGSGRTDAGVHSMGQVFHADLPNSLTIPEEKWPIVLNCRLPNTIRIIRAQHTPSEFHARFDAVGKTYRYCISSASILSPFDAGLVWHRPLSWSPDILREAIRLYQGEHDFRAFAALRGNEPNPIPSDYFIRRIFQASYYQQNDHHFITFTGSGFLYKMVRLLVGAAFESARGKLPLTELKRLITQPGTYEKSPLCAPAGGLTLMQVHYDQESLRNLTYTLGKVSEL